MKPANLVVDTVAQCCGARHISGFPGNDVNYKYTNAVPPTPEEREEMVLNAVGHRATLSFMICILSEHQYDNIPFLEKYGFKVTHTSRNPKSGNEIKLLVYSNPKTER